MLDFDNFSILRQHSLLWRMRDQKMKRNPSYVLNKCLLDLQATVNKYGINKHTLIQNIY